MGVVRAAEFPKAAEQEVCAQIDAIEAALAEAKAGNLQSVTIIAMCHDGTTLHRWSACPDLVMLLGHIERLKQLVGRRIDGTV